MSDYLKRKRICVLPGDGIGIEVMEAVAADRKLTQ